MDSQFSHANWAAGIGGVSFPLLADFHPKGAVAQAYGLYLADKGVTDRATVIVDAGGTIRHISSVTPAGQRDMQGLLGECERVAAAYEGAVGGLPAPQGLQPGLELYVKSRCGFSRSALLARENLHAQEAIAVHNVSDDPAALSRLKGFAGSGQAPCLLVGEQPLHESADIVRHLVTQATGFWTP